VCIVPKLFLIEEIVEQKEVADMVAIDRGKEDIGHFFWMKNQEFLLIQSLVLLIQEL
jgi:hypothetical protein